MKPLKGLLSVLGFMPLPIRFCKGRGGRARGGP